MEKRDILDLYERIASLEVAVKGIDELKEDCEKCRTKKVVDGLIWIVVAAVAVAVLALVLRSDIKKEHPTVPTPFSAPQPR